MRSLNDTSAGSLSVLTLCGSIYTLDFYVRTFVRDAAPPDHGLRRDGDEVHRIAMMSCEEGKPTTLVIDLDVPIVDYATKTTTPVPLIETLPPVAETLTDDR